MTKPLTEISDQEAKVGRRGLGGLWFAVVGLWLAIVCLFAVWTLMSEMTPSTSRAISGEKLQSISSGGLATLVVAARDAAEKNARAVQALREFVLSAMGVVAVFAVGGTWILISQQIKRSRGRN
jgi:hypothetical protein